MFKKILLVIAVIVALFLVVAAFQPSEYRVVRSATIPAPAAIVFAQANDLHRWNAWSPWAKLDPSAQYHFDGPPAGNGASMSWAGNDQVGEGRMTITESRPNELLRMKLNFLKPFASTADTEFTFKGTGNETVMTWTMSGRKNFMSKAVCLFMNMDKMVGGQFEQGLANLKQVVSSGAAKQ